MRVSRRDLVRTGARWGLVAAGAPWLLGETFAEALLRTPRQTEGPFYPDPLPLDRDNDLVLVDPSITPAVGEITHLRGRVLSPAGEPLRNLVVEIWQVDHHGVYLHSGSAGGERRDAHFQGFGRFATDAKGQYYFRTIKPVPYPGRPPHIHFKVKQGDRELLTTQCYVRGHPGNDGDGLLAGIADARARRSVLVDFAALPGSKTGELTAAFDIVLGTTPTL